MDGRTSSEAATGLLRSAGLRVTAPRCAVLVWLDEHPHATAADVSAGVGGRLGALPVQSVYGALDACTQVGLLRRIVLAGHPARNERRVGDHHHHLVCRPCGRAQDAGEVTGDQAFLALPGGKVFTADEVEVVFWGLCPQCAAPGTRARRARQKAHPRLASAKRGQRRDSRPDPSDHDGCRRSG